jgi:hypothetical protein
MARLSVKLTVQFCLYVLGANVFLGKTAEIQDEMNENNGNGQ